MYFGQRLFDVKKQNKYPFSVKSFLFTIFDRFGQKIFETADMKPLGTYVWMIQLVDTKNAAQSYKGIVTLIR